MPGAFSREGSASACKRHSFDPHPNFDFSSYIAALFILEKETSLLQQNWISR